jgi:hypothetical protein
MSNLSDRQQFSVSSGTYTAFFFLGRYEDQAGGFGAKGWAGLAGIGVFS